MIPTDSRNSIRTFHPEQCSARNNWNTAQNPQTSRLLEEDPRLRKTHTTHRGEKGFIFLYAQYKTFFKYFGLLVWNKPIPGIFPHKAAFLCTLKYILYMHVCVLVCKINLFLFLSVMASWQFTKFKCIRKGYPISRIPSPPKTYSVLKCELAVFCPTAVTSTVYWFDYYRLITTYITSTSLTTAF